MGNGRDGICKTWGQYHFETFDGIYYYFPGNCSYIFTKDCGNPEPQYTVWVGDTRTLKISADSIYFESTKMITNILGIFWAMTEK